MSAPDPAHTTQQGAKTIYNTSNPFEQRFGYHRAIRKGQLIFVSGTTALKDTTAPDTSPGGSDGAGDEKSQPPAHDVETAVSQRERESKVLYAADAGKQARVAMERCVAAVEKLGGTRADVVRVRMYVSRFKDCSDVGAAYAECFGSRIHGSEVGAVATMVVVKDGFVDPDILVEIEVDAVV